MLIYTVGIIPAHWQFIECACRLHILIAIYLFALLYQMQETKYTMHFRNTSQRWNTFNRKEFFLKNGYKASGTHIFLYNMF